MSGILPSSRLKWFGVLAAFLAMAVLAYASVVLGYIGTGWRTAVDAYLHFDGSNEHIVVKELRVPRALIAAAVGASLGMAGTLLQALTKNPLADTGIVGLNAGAGLCIVIAVMFFSASTLDQFAGIAFLGAAITGLVVYALGSVGREGLTPLKMTLAGAAVAAFASSLTHALLLVDQKTMQDVLFWLAGSVQGRKLSLLIEALPYMAAAWVGAIAVAGPINTLMLGEDVARGLGQRTVLVKAFAGAVVVVLCGSSVAVAGPIGFIGLVTPHLARYLVGNDIRWVVLYSAFLGAIVLTAADIAARFLAAPGEVPIGVMTALIGTPFFIYTARKRTDRS